MHGHFLWYIKIEPSHSKMMWSGTSRTKYIHNIYCTWYYGKCVKGRIKSNSVYTNPYFLLVLWKDFAKLNPKQHWSLKKMFCWSYGGNNYLGPEEPIYGYLNLWSEAKKYEVIKNVYVHVIIYVGFMWIPGTEINPNTC